MDVVGKDVVELLSDAIERKGMGYIKVTALVNDTVGTLLASIYKDQHTLMSVILGTGTNAAFVADSKSVLKWQGPTPASGKLIINTEWGAFDDEKQILPFTVFDELVDQGSSSKGIQRFEKMVSGMYLGEIVRYILLHLITTGLFSGKSSPRLRTDYAFETAYMSR